MGNNIEKQICEAVDIIVQRAMSQAEFDRTIQGTVLSCVDATIGKYKIKYQDSTFYAYASNAEVTYSNGSSVYILVPGNDMSRDKTILGSTKRLGLNYINTITEQDTYNIIGNNTIINSTSEFSLLSYDSKNDKKNTIILYDKNKTDNLLQLDIRGLNDYLSQATHLICGGTFRTQLPIEQQAYGDYGIIFTLNFKDHSTGEPVSKYYVINADKMTGNPYKLLYDTEQIGYFEIDGANFIEIDSIVLFEKDFPKEREFNKEYQPDIFIKNLKIFGATHLSAEELDSYSLSLITPQGTYFDEKTILDKTIQAQVKIKGRVVDKNSQQLAFYWFSEKADVLTNSPEYSSYGGQGWKCLNTEKIIVEAGYDQDGNLISPKVAEWVPAGDKVIVRKTDIDIKEKRYKCVVVYDGNVISKEITIKNYDAEYNVEIVSDSGTIFYLDSGNPILTCNILNKANEIISNIDNFSFAWFSVDNMNFYQAEQAMTENPRQLQPQINLITSFKIFKCCVYDNDENYIGTASITLNNLLESKDSLYTLIIENGSQIFKYDENGISPASNLQESPIVIPELTYYIYDNSKGTVIKGDSLPNANAKWYVPNNNTMLQPLGGDGSENIVEQAIIFKGSSLSYSIVDRYQFNSLNNNIELRVEYDGLQLINRTNFLFTKEGVVGTNGTFFACRMVPNVAEGSIIPRPILINGELNYTPKDSHWFRIELWQDGEKIFDSPVSGDTFYTNEPVDIFEWSVLKNKYGRYSEPTTLSSTDVSESSNIEIISGTILEDVSFSYKDIEHPVFLSKKDKVAVSNIVKAGIKYDKKEFYCSQTIPTIKHTDGCTIELSGGFDYVIYDSDGSNPKYDNAKPFTITIFDSNSVDISKTLQYEWTIESFSYKRNEENKKLWKTVDNNNLKEDKYQIEKQINQFYVKPSNQISGECLSNSVCCLVKQETGTVVAEIRIPIHMYLNRFGLASLNGWDGNSVTLNEEGGFILAPQIGAGSKNANNQFTGVVMGEVKESNAISADIGLIGYSEGQRSFFLDAQTGKTILGTAGDGQIVLDPSEKEAVIRSGNYSTSNKTGMEINLTQPYIKFGSGKFYVSPDGALSCSGARVSGEIHAYVGDFDNTNEINFTGSNSYIHFRSKSYDEQYSFECKLSPNEFYVKSQNNWDEEDHSGLEFRNGVLEVIGKITATSGTIGGWAINKDCIKAINGCLVLYADGTILGTKNADGRSGILASEYDYELTEISGGAINMYRRSSLNQDWKQAKRQGRIYTNDAFGGGLTFSADGDRPLCFAVGGKIVMKLKHDGIKNGGPENPRLCFVAKQNNKEIEQTALYRKKVSSQDFEFQPTSTYKLQETSLKNLVNSHCVMPDKVSFDDVTNTITETWSVVRQETEFIETENPETGETEIKEELIEKTYNFSRQFSLTVKNEGSENEEVTALNVLDKDGKIVHIIQFEGF